MKIYEITRKLQRMNAHERRLFLEAELRKEKPRSYRAAELLGLLQEEISKQLRRESRAA